MLVRFRPLARLLGAVFCLSLAVTLMGATSSLLPPTTLVIFPFRQAEGLDSRAGSDFVEKLGTALKALGGLNVVMGEPTTAQADYLHVAKSEGADYYLIGFVAPPVNGAFAVIEQIVSGRSGTVVWSNTARIGAAGDILDQGPVVKNALLTYSSRGFYAVLNPTPKPANAPPTTAPKKNGFSGSGSGAPGPGATPRKPLDLPNEAYGFSSKPTAPPKTYASSANPSRFVVVASTGNLVPPVIREYTTSSMIIALKRHGQTAAQGNPDETVHWIFRGKEVCANTGAAFLVSGSVSTKSLDMTQGNLWTDAYVNVAVYDCAADKFEHTTKPLYGGAYSWKTAVDHATNAAVTNYLLKVSAPVAHA